MTLKTESMSWIGYFSHRNRSPSERKIERSFTQNAGTRTPDTKTPKKQPSPGTAACHLPFIPAEPKRERHPHQCKLE